MYYLCFSKFSVLCICNFAYKCVKNKNRDVWNDISPLMWCWYLLCAWWKYLKEKFLNEEEFPIFYFIIQCKYFRKVKIYLPWFKFDYWFEEILAIKTISCAQVILDVWIKSCIQLKSKTIKCNVTSDRIILNAIKIPNTVARLFCYRKCVQK